MATFKQHRAPLLVHYLDSLLTEEGIIPYPKPLHKKSGPLLGGPEGGDICNWAQASTVWLHGQFIKYMFHITVEPSGT